MNQSDPRTFLRQLFDAAVARAQPSEILGGYLPPPPKGRTVVIGAGKGGGAMAAALDALWPKNATLSGLVITRYGHVPDAWARGRSGSGSGEPHTNHRIELVEASHPVPDEAGLKATARMASVLQGLTADDLVIALISGGGSALLCQPAPGLSLADKQAVNKALLRSGAAIDEMNTVRKHLSGIKGGRLAAMCAPARLVSLLISDVPGDDPGVIASGPTVPDASTCADALAICRRYSIALPSVAEQALLAGAWETPKPGDACFQHQTVHVVATPRMSLEAAAALAQQHGVHAHILGDDIEGESREVGRVHAALARSVARHGTPFQKPCVILSGGETTVTVQTPSPGTRLGRGGRAGEFMLGCALALQGEAGVHALAADTDGIDGVEDNAGALIGPDTLQRAAALGLNVHDHLTRHDAYGYFEALGDLVITGPTNTNVNDFRALLVTTG